MIQQLIDSLGAWMWVILGFILLILEIAIPGVFFLWIGIAAILVGVIALLPGAIGFAWQWQVIVFLVLAVASVFVGRRLMAGGSAETDEPLLNRRAEQLVGQIVTLNEAIINGHGRVRLGDTSWRVTGPDLPAGTRVRIASAVEGTTLAVEELPG
jgi:membrane protein implicated in regulation of membrane protease activity